MEIGKDFVSLVSYNNEMSKPMKDKLYFADKLPPGYTYLFVDFGCADGALIQNLIKVYNSSSYEFVGYDCSETMISFAKTTFPGELSCSVDFTTSWDTVQEKVKSWKQRGTRYKIVLILSSVIHEIYSYETEEGIEEFWKRVKEFDFVCVRDMMCASTINRKSNPDFIMNIRKGQLGNVSKCLEDFEARWGSIDGNKNLVHFLLKYRYTINWERECNENYFPIYISEFLDKMSPEFRIDYLERFRVRFIEEKIYEDFGISLEDTTHIKVIFRKNV